MVPRPRWAWGGMEAPRSGVGAGEERRRLEKKRQRGATGRARFSSAAAGVRARCAARCAPAGGPALSDQTAPPLPPWSLAPSPAARGMAEDTSDSGHPHS
jgi:hypothetical protein